MFFKNYIYVISIIISFIILKIIFLKKRTPKVGLLGGPENDRAGLGWASPRRGAHTNETLIQQDLELFLPFLQLIRRHVVRPKKGGKIMRR